MMKNFACAMSLAAALCVSAPTFATETPSLEQVRAQIQELKQAYEARIRALEQKLERLATPAAPEKPIATATAPAAAPVAGTPKGPSADISLILSGTYGRFSQDPNAYRIQGFQPAGDELAPGKRGFSLGESELSISASIDPRFSGRLTLALSPENEVGVEEAYFQNSGTLKGVNIKAGRVLSGLGYLNSQHAHTWDFVDAPLVYKGMFGGQYRTDGVQAKWLLPVSKFVEMGIEAGNGGSYPGTDRNRNGIGSVAMFAHAGDDLGDSASWRLGVSHLRTRAAARGYTDAINQVNNAFDGRSKMWILDGVFKWAPGGNASRTNLKLQGEYFRRQERGDITYDVDTTAQVLPFSSTQSGAYLQGVYQFMPGWRVGVRHDRLSTVSPAISFGGSGLSNVDFPSLEGFRPTRNSLMLDYAPSEFSRFRLQFAQDKTRPGVSDKQILLQYVMSLGAHGAHSY
jgi:hypothetical protein